MINIKTHIISEAFEQLSKSEKLNESKLPEAYIIEPKYRDGDVVFVGDASGYHGTFLIDGDFKKIPEELYHNIRRITKYSNLDKPYYKVEYKIDSDSLFEKDYQEFFNRIIPILRDVGISVLKSAEDITESKLTEKLDKKEIDLKLLNKDPSIFVSPEDAFELSQYLDSKNILYDTRNVMTPIPEKNYEEIPQRAFDIDYSSPRSIATPNEMVTLRHSDCSILGSISAQTSAFDFPYISPASNKLPRISRSDYYKLKSLFKDLNKIWKKPEYQDKQNELVDKISDIVSEIQGIDESLNESEKPLRKMNTNELRDIAVSLGADRKKLYGTSKQALILTIDQLKKKNKDNSKGNISVNKIAEDYNEVNECKLGTNEYEANPKRKQHIEMYRKFANLNESEEITEDNINDWALQKTATYCNRHPDRIKAEILGKRYSEYERD